MRIEMMVDEKSLPKQSISKITDELNRRLVALYPDVRIRVRKKGGGSDRVAAITANF